MERKLHRQQNRGKISFDETESSDIGKTTRIVRDGTSGPVRKKNEAKQTSSKSRETPQRNQARSSTGITQTPHKKNHRGAKTIRVGQASKGEICGVTKKLCLLNARAENAKNLQGTPSHNDKDVTNKVSDLQVKLRIAIDMIAKLKAENQQVAHQFNVAIVTGSIKKQAAKRQAQVLREKYRRALHQYKRKLVFANTKLRDPGRENRQQGKIPELSSKILDKLRSISRHNKRLRLDLKENTATIKSLQRCLQQYQNIAGHGVNSTFMPLTTASGSLSSHCAYIDEPQEAARDLFSHRGTLIERKQHSSGKPKGRNDNDPGSFPFGFRSSRISGQKDRIRTIAWFPVIAGLSVIVAILLISYSTVWEYF